MDPKLNQMHKLKKSMPFCVGQLVLEVHFTLLLPLTWVGYTIIELLLEVSMIIQDSKSHPYMIIFHLKLKNISACSKPFVGDIRVYCSLTEYNRRIIGKTCHHVWVFFRLQLVDRARSRSTFSENKIKIRGIWITKLDFVLAVICLISYLGLINFLVCFSLIAIY